MLKRRGCYFIIGSCQHGFIDNYRQLALICESDMLGERVHRRQDNRRTINTDALIRNPAELSPGQPVVHLQHGVGRYQGIHHLRSGGRKKQESYA